MADPLIWVYSIVESCLALFILMTNFVVIFVYLRAKHIRTPCNAHLRAIHIRTPTNMYIFSLAITDFLAGAVGIPFTVFSVLTRWPSTFLPCLAIHLILCALCTISTFHLLAMAVDRYLSICRKRFDHQHHSITRETRKTRARFLITVSWIFGSLLGGLPLLDGFGFASKTMGKFTGECYFTDVVDYRYLVYIIFFGTIILPSGLIAFCYMAIYSHIRHEENSVNEIIGGNERRRRIIARRKLIRILIILVMTFAICWYPLYIINTFDLFFQMRANRAATLMAVVLSHVNCALNPMIYAYGVPGFKQHLRRFSFFSFFSSVSNISMQGTLPGGGGGNGVVPLPGINAHAAWCNNLARNSSCTNGGGAMNNSRRAGSIGTDRRQSTPQTVTAAGATTVNQSGRRSVSTVNPVFSNAMLRESRHVAQFRHHHSVMLRHQQRHAAPPQNSIETDETVADEILETAPNAMSFDNSFGTNDSSQADKCTGECCQVQQSEIDRKRSGQSIASRISVWSLRIFTGQWRMLRRRKSSTQSCKESGTIVETHTENSNAIKYRNREARGRNDEAEECKMIGNGKNDEEEE